MFSKRNLKTGSHFSTVTVTAPDLIRIYSERKQKKEQTDMKNVQFSEEKSKFKVTDKAVQKQL